MSLSSLLTQLVIPTNFCIALLVLAFLFFMLRLRKTAASVAVFAVAWLLAWSMPITSIWAGGYLENLHPYQNTSSLPEAEAIVVLGGNTANNRINWFLPVSVGTFSRVERAAELYAHGKSSKVVVSGAALDGGYSEAQVMAGSLHKLGVPFSAVVTESESLNTRENALYSVQQLRLLGINNILLVTSALHMPRAVAVFSQHGLQVTAVPTPPQITAPDVADFSVWQPSVRTLTASRSIIKEYVGVLVYWARGWL
ncbi:MAG TPA: YdcF family protein [Candidatus Paenalcaligenes intestinipullorum]|uniref:YdcF family protein n=1 Tax=Candidatus Paenalcaligenes intestinipullorum TaxID=2838718 RepID=A0A9D2RH53_9BURK|nr:YdcF family protein [Candidatus Paenalcaligenes intestinipullorum]